MTITYINSVQLGVLIYVYTVERSGKIITLKLINIPTTSIQLPLCVFIDIEYDIANYGHHAVH